MKTKRSALHSPFRSGLRVSPNPKSKSGIQNGTAGCSAEQQHSTSRKLLQKRACEKAARNAGKQSRARRRLLSHPHPFSLLSNLPLQHGRKSSKRSADLSPRSALGRRPCSSRCASYASATAMLTWTAAKASRCRTPHKLFAFARQHPPGRNDSPCRLPPTAKPSLKTKRRARPCPIALQSSCDVRPVKVKPNRNVSTHSARA
jgi:hypothetical protein